MKLKLVFIMTCILTLIMSTMQLVVSSCTQCSCVSQLPACPTNTQAPVCLNCSRLCCQPAVETCDSITRFCMPSTGLENECSKTFFQPRSIIEQVMFTLAQNTYFNYYLQQPARLNGFTIAFTPFVQKSTQADRLARFFLPCTRTSCERNALVIAQDGSGDINPLWLECDPVTSDTFRSSVAFCPERSVAGFVFSYHQNLGFCLPCMWLDVNFALVSAKHRLRVTETPVSVAVPGQTALDFFNNSCFNASRLCDRNINQIGVDDIEIKLGYNFVWCPNSHFAFYGSVIAPASPKQKNKCLFDAVIGRRHTALGFGINAGRMFWCCGQHSLTYLFEFDFRFFLARKQQRPLDLNNGDWSRFLPVAFSDQPNTCFPGVNFFTQPVRISPRSMVNIWAALHYEYCTLQTEIGYNFWLKERDRICLSSCAQFPDNLGIFDLTGDTTGDFTSASGATIHQAAHTVVADTVFTPLNTCSFNLDSAAQGLAMTHTLYGSLGVDRCPYGYPTLLAIGAAYEFSQKNTALSQWSVWFKLNMGF